jgi:multidrug efflux pump subunit AcrA (membrane-fusion protein)
MKNLVIFFLLLIACVAGYYAVRSNLRVDVLGLRGETAKVGRGDLTLPIQASGEVRPIRRVEIKAEASGEVIEILREAGERVRKDDLILRLDKSEEERSVQRAQLDRERAQARLETARLTQQRAETADLEVAQAAVDQIEALLPLYKLRVDRLEDFAEDDPANPYHKEERVQRETTYQNQLAQLAAAKARLESAKLTIEQAKHEVTQAEAALETAKNQLADAEERLEKTDIFAPCDGVVGNVYTQVGAVIQGGKTTFTGGTLLAIILDDSRIVVRAEVDESEIGRVRQIAPTWARPGNDGTLTMPDDPREAESMAEHAVEITVESFREEVFSGVIERIFPEPRSISGVTTYDVDVVISSDNRDLLFVGMKAEVEFTAEKVTDVVLCPNEAVREAPNGEQLGVYIPVETDDPNRPEKRFVPCKFGLDNGIYSEVREGIEEGATVYTKLPATRDED